jgi:pyrroloquinoline quinone biosynthesis protein E
VTVATPRPYNLVAELTYRCPLRCVYCSNPIGYQAVRETLDGTAWCRAIDEAAALGTLHVGLTGGEPTLHPDLAEIVRGTAKAGLYSHLVTAGTTLDRDGLADLQRDGLRSVQLSLQDSIPEAADRIAGVNAHEKKLAFAAHVADLGLALTVNVVLHRENLERVSDIIELARGLGARTLELANTQYQGWALANRDALIPTREALDAATRVVEEKKREAGGPEILFVLPDYFRDRPKPCMGGWAQRIVVMQPDGRVLPCHGAAEIPNLEFWRFGERSLADCWQAAPGMNAFRGESWMQDPCRSCPERAQDFGGCRCQAAALTGNAAETDPTCSLAPHHALIQEARQAASRDETALRYRGAL